MRECLNLAPKSLVVIRIFAAYSYYNHLLSCRGSYQNNGYSTEMVSGKDNNLSHKSERKFGIDDGVVSGLRVCFVGVILVWM